MSRHDGREQADVGWNERLLFVVQVTLNSAKFTLSPAILFSLACILIAGELIAGTNAYFASMAAIAFIAAGITYNLLGGLGTMSGIAFTRLALVTFVIAQFGKVILFEPADQNLRVPNLTITVYAVYFIFLMLGTFLFFGIRVRLPRPFEPNTSTQFKYLYVIALAGGLAGWLVLTVTAEETLTHGYARALTFFLPFSLVIAVDDRIRLTGGRHSIGWRALVPASVMVLQGFIGANRSYFAEPFLIVFLTCYLRGYRFRRKHVFAGVSVLTVFFLFISPFFLYSRDWRGEGDTFGQQFSTMVRVAKSAPSQWSTIVSTVSEGALAGRRTVNYFDKSWAVTLNRLALIGPDSTLIDACSSGFHYGFTSIKLDLLTGLPRFLYKNKPEYGSEPYLGHLDGQESDAFVTTYSTITSISDSFGAFGFLGVMVYAFIIPPLTFVVYESIFDMRRPWGTVAAVMLVMSLTEGSMGEKIATTMIRQPIYIVVISLVAAWVLRMIPTIGERPQRLKAGNGLFGARS